MVAGLAAGYDELLQTTALDVDMSTEDGLIPALIHSAGRWKLVTGLSLPEASPSLPPPGLRGSGDVFDPVTFEIHTLTQRGPTDREERLIIFITFSGLFTF